jgi:hypothetical protein
VLLAQARDRLARLRADALQPSVDDANRHLGRLVHRGCVLGSGLDRLDDVERYVRAIVYRLDHLAGAQVADQRRMAEVVARRGGVTVLPQDIPTDVIEDVVAWVKSRHPLFETPITLSPGHTIGDALGLIHKRAHGAVVVVDDRERPVGVMHCFSQDAGYCRSCTELGMHISFGGTITYRGSHAVREAARLVPDELLLVETDLPPLDAVTLAAVQQISDDSIRPLVHQRW